MRSIPIIVIALALALGACATSDPNVVPVYGAQRMSHVYDATVLSVRPVTIDGSQSGVGAGAGAIVGGIAGSAVGGGNGAAIASAASMFFMDEAPRRMDIQPTLGHVDS